MAHYDLIIRNGRIVDGTGTDSYVGDVAICGDQIAAIGEDLAGEADEEIDAAGLVVTPGFVDVHTHFDGQATWDSHLAPSSSLGATTIVMGNCGVGFAPCKPDDRTALIGLMEGVEEIPEVVMSEGLPWDWESFEDYLTSVESRPHDIDLAVFFPHGPLRVNVMGERAINREPATIEDLKQMRMLLERGLDAGAVGFSTSRTFVHRTNKGVPTPTYNTATDELKFLGEALSAERGNMFQMIADWEDADEEFSILRHICEETGAKATFTCLQIEATPDLHSDNLARVEQAQSEGLDIKAQVLTRPVGIMMGHGSSMSPFYARPTFRQHAHLPLPELVEKLREPEIKAAILAEENEGAHVFVRIAAERYETMFPLESPVEYLPPRDSSIRHRAEAEGVSPESWLYDYLLTDDGQALIYFPAANYHDGVPDMLDHPFSIAALGDGGAHVGSICDASTNIYLLTKWVMKEKRFSLERAIHLITQQPAAFFSFNDRGALAPGMKADINIFDMDGLQLHRPHLVHDLPAGGKRFLQEAEGLIATFKSGVKIFANGTPTGALPGRLLRGKQDVRQPELA
jgi:N-acyl-D-aspartate/D-glutamate deacylase